ncbi:MAG: two-component system, cell cycle response regulator DivK [Pyrinomonadaceae bacterium]|nr:two-component system, cell cycle response regulator DivK [Pyrinomonadaceae bacterium]MDX6271060.1 two-component system, cell cycle response regulator DivK [Acidobacteriota bacterium]
MPNILIVDDSDIWRRLTKDILKKNPYRLFEADSGERALEVARETPVDLVIMDYRMRRLDGLDTSRRLREIPGCEQVPVILITSEEFPGDCEETPVQFVDGYVDKKHLVHELDECVKRHLDRDARVA